MLEGILPLWINNFVASIDSRATGVNNSGDLNFFTSTGQSYSGVYDNPSATLTLGTDNNATFAGTSGAITSSDSLISSKSGAGRLILATKHTMTTRFICMGQLEERIGTSAGKNVYSAGSHNFKGGYGTGGGNIEIDGQVVITSARALTNIGTISSGQITTSGGVEVGSNNINFADNGKARFGNSADLQIFRWDTFIY